MKLHNRILTAILLTTSLTSVAHANFTITTPETTIQNTGNSGTSTITSTGSVIVTLAPSTNAISGSGIVNNAGTVTATTGGAGLFGCFVGGDWGNLTLTNQGSITLFGTTGATGLVGITERDDVVNGLFSGVLSVNNSGTITVNSTVTSGMTAVKGIIANQGLYVNNSGNINVTTTQGTDVGGIEFLLNNTNPTTTSTVINTNSITVNNTAGLARGVLLRNYGTGTNTGTITVTSSGDIASGVFLDGANNSSQSNITFTNEGTITATGTIAGKTNGIAADGGYVTITNKGKIITNVTGAAAISFIGEDRSQNTTTNSTLNYYNSGNLVGAVLFSPGASYNNAINLYSSEDGVDQTITYEGTATVTAMDNDIFFATAALTGGATELTIANSSIHSFASTTATDSASQVQSSIVNRSLNNQLLTQETDSLYKKPIDTGFYMWVDTFGSDRKRPKSSDVQRVHTKSGGVVFGAEKAVTAKTSAGFFVGGLRSTMDIGTASGTKVRSTGGMIGAYGNMMVKDDVLLNGVFEIGYINHKRDRAVYESNLSTTNDKITLKGSYNEVFISPSVTIAKSFKCKTTDIVPSLTLRYTGQKLSQLKEQGDSNSAHIVKGRYVSSAATRAQLSATHMLNANHNLNFYGGLEYSKVLSNKVTLSNVGSTNLSTSFKPKKIGYTDLFIGAKWNQKFRKALAYIGIEGSKGLRKGKGGENYSVSLSIGADF